MVGCGSAPHPAVSRTLPGSVAFSEMPASPVAEALPPAVDWAVSVEGVQVVPGDTRSGILLSLEKAQRAARIRIAYDELRALYSIDLRTWEREREVYGRYLTLADEEIATWHARAERSWWERHDGEIGLFLGLLVGVVVTGSIAVAVESALHP